MGGAEERGLPMTAEGAGRLTQIDFEKWWDLYKLRLPSWKREGAKSWVRLGYDLRTEEIDALREDNQRLRDVADLVQGMFDVNDFTPDPSEVHPITRVVIYTTAGWIVAYRNTLAPPEEVEHEG